MEGWDETDDDEEIAIPRGTLAHSHRDLERDSEMNNPTYAELIRWSREQVASEEPKAPSFFLSPSIMVAGLFLVILVAIALWWFFTRKKESSQPASPASATAAAAAAQPAEARPTKPVPRPRDGEKIHYMTATGTPVDAKSVKHRK